MLNPACHCAHSLYSNHKCAGEVALVSLCEGEPAFMICSACVGFIHLHDDQLKARYDLTITL